MAETKFKQSRLPRDADSSFAAFLSGLYLLIGGMAGGHWRLPVLPYCWPVMLAVTVVARQTRAALWLHAALPPP